MLLRDLVIARGVSPKQSNAFRPRHCESSSFPSRHFERRLPEAIQLLKQCSISLNSHNINDWIGLKDTYTSMIYWIASELLLLAMTEPLRVFFLIAKTKAFKGVLLFLVIEILLVILLSPVIARGVSPKQSNAFRPRHCERR